MMYEITNTESGVVLGVYEGETAADAIQAMLDDAGCTDAPDPALVAREVDRLVYSWDSLEYGFCDDGTPAADAIDAYFTLANFRAMFRGLSMPSTEAFEALRRAAHAALDAAEDDSIHAGFRITLGEMAAEYGYTLEGFPRGDDEDEIITVYHDEDGWHVSGELDDASWAPRDDATAARLRARRVED